MLQHPKVAELQLRQQWVQRTPEWYAKRRELLTASDVAAALDIPPYASYRGSSRADLLKKKIANKPLLYNTAIMHGVKHEDDARRLVEEAIGESIQEYGLLVHPQYPWLGASPDGVSSLGKMVEIKCPMRRHVVPGEVPHHYYPQVQVQLEVCDLDTALFVQYKPGEILDIAVVERDRAWFADNVDKLYSFFLEYQAGKDRYVPEEPPVCLIDPGMYFPKKRRLNPGPAETPPHFI